MKSVRRQTHLIAAISLLLSVPTIMSCDAHTENLDSKSESATPQYHVVRGPAEVKNTPATPSLDAASLLGYWYSAPEPTEAKRYAKQLQDPAEDNFDWATYLGYWYSGGSDTSSGTNGGSDTDDETNEDEDKKEKPNDNDWASGDNDSKIHIGDVDVSDTTTSSGDQIQPGQQITVVITNGEVSHVDYDEDVKGPVDAIIDHNTIMVMGQTVRISESTKVGSEQDGRIIEGDVIEISGPRDASQLIHATFIEEKRDPSDYSVRGTVSNLDRSSRSFMIGDLVVSYRHAEFDDFSHHDLKDNDLVEVEDERRSYEPGSYLMRATEIERSSDDPGSTSSGDPASSVQSTSGEPKINDSENIVLPSNWVEHTAIITFVNRRNTWFKLGSSKVRILSDTAFVDGIRSDITINRLVSVKGRLSRRGIVRAREITFEGN